MGLFVHLQIEREHMPLCVETFSPEFSWYLEAPERCVRQTAYRLTVTTADGLPLWDSGQVFSDEMTAVYAGAELPAEATCRVALTVWDSLGRTATADSRFRIGLRAESFEAPAWSGAKWIGTGTRDLRPEALSVFDLSCQITVTEDTVQAGLIFGMDDPRLADRNRNLLGTQALPGESYFLLALNIKASQAEIYRVGYTETDSMETPLYALPLPAGFLDSATHMLQIRLNNSMADVLLDRIQLNIPGEKKNPFDTGALNLSPGPGGQDYTAFPELCRIGIWATGTATFQNLTVRNFRKPGSVLFRACDTSLTLKDDQLVLDPTIGGLPMLRREFSARPGAQAYLTVTARGVYEAYINGQKVGSDWLAPGLTQYNRTHMYQVYDVTELIRPGANAIGIQLGEGWWSGMLSFQGENTNFFGDTQSVLAKLTLEYSDGTVDTIVTDEQYDAFSDGPIRHASLFQGQVYDANKEIPDWTLPGFTGHWSSAVEIPLSAENAILEDLPAIRDIQRLNYDRLRCVGQIGNGVKCVAKLPAKRVSQPRPGVFVYDFGQNLSGIPEIHFPAELTGKKATLRYAEVLYPELPEYEANRGMIMVENLRAALVTDEVILSGNALTFRPQFTFHGFRYMELTGLDAALPLESVFALALSSATELTADYRCSEEGVNRLFRNICWSLRDNFLSIPTDCPQRNERMGWSGDLSVFARTAVFLTDADAFLRRHLIAIRDLQSDDGKFPDIAPIGGGFGGILWGSVGMTVPWEVYLQYGDKRILEANYDAMAKYIAWLNAHVDVETGIQTAGELGDWLGPQNAATEGSLLWMSYYVYDLEIMAKTAEILGKPEAPFYADLREMIRQRFCEVYFDPQTAETVYSSEEAAHGNRTVFEPVNQDKPLPPKAQSGGYRMDTQSSYCVPLALRVVASHLQKQAGVNLARTCERANEDDGGNLRPPYSLMTGFIGTAWILPALTMAGRDDIAYRMLTNRSYPSWLYPVEQGATTIWERLDSYTVENGFGGHNSMNSFNHYSFGAVGQWMISRSLGIARETPGFRRFTLCPMPDETGTITQASGWCVTASGRIESAWTQTATGYEYTFTVPANTSCLLQLPGNPFATVLESGMEPSKSEGVTALGHNGQAHQFWLDSGTYHFTIVS